MDLGHLKGRIGLYVPIAAEPLHTEEMFWEVICCSKSQNLVGKDQYHHFYSEFKEKAGRTLQSLSLEMCLLIQQIVTLHTQAFFFFFFGYIFLFVRLLPLLDH